MASRNIGEHFDGYDGPSRPGGDHPVERGEAMVNEALRRADGGELRQAAGARPSEPQRTDDQHPEVILAIANLAMTYAIAICRHADLRTKTQMFRLIASALALSCALTTPSRAEVVTLICTVSIVTFVFDIDFTK